MYIHLQNKPPFVILLWLKADRLPSISTAINWFLENIGLDRLQYLLLLSNIEWQIYVIKILTCQPCRHAVTTLYVRIFFPLANWYSLDCRAMQISLGLSLRSMYVFAEAGVVKLTIVYSGSVICTKMRGLICVLILIVSCLTVDRNQGIRYTVIRIL